MITAIVVLLSVIVFLLIASGICAYMMWQKVKTYLTWNTRYQTTEYEQAITTKKRHLPSLKAKKTEVRGREIKEMPELVDLADLDFETGYAALEELGK